MDSSRVDETVMKPMAFRKKKVDVYVSQYLVLHLFQSLGVRLLRIVSFSRKRTAALAEAYGPLHIFGASEANRNVHFRKWD